jgi:hypothetical protein
MLVYCHRGFKGIQLHRVLYFPVALESVPLTWPESLKPNSIDSWEDLKRALIDNFQGSMIRAGTRHDLSQVNQEMKETLRSYTRCFFKMRATIANITDEDVICCFQNELFSKHTYHDFRRNRPTTTVELHDMMARWLTRRTRITTAFPSATATSRATAMAVLTRASRTTRGTPKSAS